MLKVEERELLKLGFSPPAARAIAQAVKAIADLEAKGYTLATVIQDHEIRLVAGGL